MTPLERLTLEQLAPTSDEPAPTQPVRRPDDQWRHDLARLLQLIGDTVGYHIPNRNTEQDAA